MPETPEPRTVVVGYDGSATSRRALQRAADAAGAAGRVVVVTAVPEADPTCDIETAPAEPRQLLEEAAALVRGHGVDVSIEADDGDPVDALIAAAQKERAVLIVVGARGESYTARALRGSVSERLVARSPCDLLITR